MCLKYLCCGGKKDSNENGESKKKESTKFNMCSILIVIASFIINVTVEGSYNVWSIIYSTIVKEFRSTRSDAAWAGSVLQSTPSLFGPFANAIVSRFGCRAATIVGAFMASFGWLIGSYSKNIIFLSFTFGLLGGFGLSLAYIPSLYIVALYYRRRLTLASGIAVAGSGIGAFIYAPLTDFLMKTYSWSITVLIFACVFLQMIACGLLFTIPEKFFPFTETPSSISQLIQTQRNESANPKESSENMLIRSFKSYNKLFFKGNYLRKKIEIALPPSSLESHDSTNISPIDELNIVNKEQNLTIPSNNTNANAKSFKPSEQVILRQRLEKLGLRKSRVSSKQKVEISNAIELPESNLETNKRKSDMTWKTHPDYDESFIDDENAWVDFSILRNGVYARFWVQSLLVFLAYDTPLVNMPGFAVSKGISSLQAAFLLSIFGISNTVGQIIIGWLSGFDFCNTLLLFTFTTQIAGFATVLVSFASSYAEMAIYCAVYGIFISANFALPAVIMVEALGVNYLNDAFGICSITQGLAILVGPPIGGYFYDITGNFKMTYIVAGSTMLASTIPFTLNFMSKCLQVLCKKCQLKKVAPEDKGEMK